MCLKERTKHLIIGAGRLFDFTGSYNSILFRKYLDTPSRQIDYQALLSDWQAVGGDLLEAMESYAERKEIRKNSGQEATEACE